MGLVPTIFDDFVRTNAEPALEEDSFTFLNRAATPYWQRVREFVDQAFSAYPHEHARDLRARFRGDDWSGHIGAWWELYLFTLFRALGFEVEVHPAIRGTSKRPDFRIGTGNGAFLLEARHVAAGFISDEARVGRDEWITAPLERLRHPEFMVGVTILNRASQRPSRMAVTNGVIEWLDGLDTEEAAAADVFDRTPRKEFGANDWRFELKAFAVKPDARGRPGRRLVGLYPSSGGFDNTIDALRSALKEKAGKYGHPDEPFVLAPYSHRDTWTART